MSFITTINPDYYLKLSDLPNHRLEDFEIPLLELKTNLYTCEWKTSVGISTSFIDYGEATFKRDFGIYINACPAHNSVINKCKNVFVNTFVNDSKNVSKDVKLNINTFVNDSKNVSKDVKLNINTFVNPSKKFVTGADISTGIKLSYFNEIDKNSVVPLNTFCNRNANAGQVIGDIRFYDTILNETNYDIILTPYGYGKWKEMLTGDYPYTKALCKYSMQASLNADRPNTRMYLHKVDVPDVVDRGIVELTKDNQPFFVEFSKEDTRKFHIVPELNVSIKSYSGVDANPIIIPYNTTIDGFYVTMKAGGDFVEGKISWTARGY